VYRTQVVEIQHEGVLAVEKIDGFRMDLLVGAQERDIGALVAFRCCVYALERVIERQGVAVQYQTQFGW